MKRATPNAIISCKDFSWYANEIKSRIENNAKNGNKPVDLEGEYALYAAMLRIVEISAFDWNDLKDITEEVEHKAISGVVYLAEHFDEIVERFHIEDRLLGVSKELANLAVEMLDWGDYPSNWFEGSAWA